MSLQWLHQLTPFCFIGIPDNNLVLKTWSGAITVLTSWNAVSPFARASMTCRICGVYVCVCLVFSGERNSTMCMTHIEAPTAPVTGASFYGRLFLPTTHYGLTATQILTITHYLLSITSHTYASLSSSASWASPASMPFFLPSNW